MLDLEIAKRVLKEKNLTLVIAKNGKIIFQSSLHGIVSLLNAIESLGRNLEEAAVADKVVGKAAALLCAFSRVKSVFALTLSIEGRKTLEGSGIIYEFENSVPKILDKSGKDMCPFEKFSLSIENPKEAYFKLKKFADSLLKRR